MKKSRRTPIIFTISYMACALCLMAILPAAIFLPRFVAAYAANYAPSTPQDLLPVTIFLYVGMAIAAAVLILLLCLLRVAQKGSIFTPLSGQIVLAVACLVFAEGAVFAGLSFFVLPIAALAVTVVAVVMGLCFLVVSHVLREAADIKAENDATI